MPVPFVWFRLSRRVTAKNKISETNQYHASRNLYQGSVLFYNIYYYT